MATADELYKTDGEAIKGLVVESHRDRIVFNTVDGEQTVLKSEIDEIFFDDSERNYLYLGNQALDNDQLNAALPLLNRAKRLNPRLGEVHDALGRAEGMRIKFKARWSLKHPEKALWAKWGLRLKKTDDVPVVVRLAPEQFAKRQGFQVGDQLVAIWGHSAAYRSLQAVADDLLGPTGSEVKVTLSRDLPLLGTAISGEVWPGFTLVLTESGLVIDSVASFGNQAGLRVGDRVTALNQTSTRYMPMASVQQLIKRSIKSGLVVTIHKDLFIQRSSDESVE
jgi:hypothetical protein